jgi:hypothetical protein
MNVEWRSALRLLCAGDAYKTMTMAIARRQHCAEGSVGCRCAWIEMWELVDALVNGGR